MNIEEASLDIVTEIVAMPFGIDELENDTKPPLIVTAVTVQFTDPNHTHNGLPVKGQPVSLTPELAEACLKERIAHLIED